MKRFAGTYRWAQTSYLWTVLYYVQCTSVRSIFCSFNIELSTPSKYQQHIIHIALTYLLLEHCNKFGGVQRTRLDFSSDSNFQIPIFTEFGILFFFRSINHCFFIRLKCFCLVFCEFTNIVLGTVPVHMKQLRSIKIWRFQLWRNIQILYIT